MERGNWKRTRLLLFYYTDISCESYDGGIANGMRIVEHFTKFQIWELHLNAEVMAWSDETGIEMFKLNRRI